MVESKFSARSRCAPRSIVDLVMKVTNADLHRELTEFYQTYSKEHGEVNLLLRYTSTLTEEEQNWLLEHDSKAYFEGLPEFAQAFIIAKMNAAKRSGRLDDTPGEYLHLFLRGQLNLKKTGPQR